MRMRAILAGGAAASAMALALGCGGGSSSVSSVDTTSVKGLCPTVLAAEKRYQAATAEMGLRFQNLVLETAARKSLQALLPRTQQLQRVSVGSQRAKLTPLVTALSNQLKTFVALEDKNLDEAAKYGNSINAPLRQGLKDLQAICRGA